MSRLADYFIIVGYDHEKEQNGKSCGKIIQRFPETDWDNCPFTPGIELFCQPAGWSLSTARQQPTFFVSVLTDIDADRHYCACMTFYETVSITTSKMDDDDMDETITTRQSLMYAPKSLVLVSRWDYFETFRNCLGLIYTVYIEGLQYSLETMIGNILGCIQVPGYGGPQVRFSLGAGDRQAIQPPLSTTLPTTCTGIAMLFKELGIQNCIDVFSAAITDHKVLFHSKSFSRLSEASQSLIALMYPLKYSYVYIPILPQSLQEVLMTPTPFIAGIHSSMVADVMDLLDVIIVNLDGGSITIPECVSIPQIPDTVLCRTYQALTMILDPDLLTSDYAFQLPPQKVSSLVMQDKQIRAVFIRLWAELFTGYRSCLTVIRIHPDPFITFHKAKFLGHHSLVENDFLTRVLEGMSFGRLVSERGPPFRVCDIYDEVYATLPEVLQEERNDQNKAKEHTSEIATQLYINENPNSQPFQQKLIKPPEGAYNRIHQPQFPIIDWLHVQEIIDEGLASVNEKSKLSQIRTQQPRIVPIGPHILAVSEKMQLLNNNARRVEVLRNCCIFIFDNKIADARKIFPAVLRALKSKVARLSLTQELAEHIRNHNRAMLEHQQFDLIVRLLNCALQNDSTMDENGVAAAILPLATTFCRKLCTGVIQFVYTCIQEHAIWGNMQFWESTFYQDVEAQIRQLYLPQYEEQAAVEKSMSSSSTLDKANGDYRKPGMLHHSLSAPNGGRLSYVKPREVGALEIAAEQLRSWPNVAEFDRDTMINNEESTVYSQAIHYANRMVYLRVPLDAAKSLKNALSMEGESTSNSNITNSIGESDSIDAESGFDEQEVSDCGSTVVKFVTRFVDKVCTDSGVTQDHIRSLHTMIPGVVAMHIETLDAVHRESKRLPPIQKPKILTPSLLVGEEMVLDGLRVYLLPDGREEGLGGNLGGPTLIPAEGAIFLTTYRVLFKGLPCDPLACEQIVVRSFPVSSLTKEKKLSTQYLAQVEQYLQDILQLRSNTFQLMKIGFDEEVGSDNVESFRKLVHKLTSPLTLFDTFAFTGQHVVPTTPLKGHKNKDKTLKGFTKKTLMRTARKVGIKSKDHSKTKQKYAIPNTYRHSYVSGAGSDSESERVGDDISEYSVHIAADPKLLDKLSERSSFKDYERLGLVVNGGGRTLRNEQFRISSVNANYSVCRSYPALLVVPQSVSDDSIKKFARSHRQYRFPVITWRHAKTKGLLLRASGFHSKGLSGVFKTHHSSSQLQVGATTSAPSETLSTSNEQEKYFAAIVTNTPMGNLSRHTATASDSITSLDSLMLSPDVLSSLPDTPSMARKSSNRLSRVVHGIRSSGGRVKSLSKFGSLRDRRQAMSMPPVNHDVGMRLAMKANGTVDGSDMLDGAHAMTKASLYILGEKTQMKNIKADQFMRCEFIPVDFCEVRHVKASFKKLIRACIPSSSAPADQEVVYLKAVQDSEWLVQIQGVLQLSGAIVDLIDLQGSSVMVCLEDGWDVTTQVISIAQLLMDPYYRTVKGFQALVEKEWLSFGHRFTHRSSLTSANQASGFAPIFLQFLDTVHQIVKQFPLSFEFNQYYLKFLAYHYVSNRFRTFMFDNELERMESGCLFEESPRMARVDEDTSNTSGNSDANNRISVITSVWDYIEKHHRKTSVFYNVCYVADDSDGVLRPYHNQANLAIWDYYLEEDLAHGPSYDFDLVSKEVALSEEPELPEGAQGKRKIINGCYNNVTRCLPDGCFVLLQELHRLQFDLEQLPQKWKSVWDNLDHPDSEPLHTQTSFVTQQIRSHGRTLHKRSTVEILVRGKMTGEAVKVFGQHHFEKFDFTTPTYCDQCSQLLWGLVKQGYQCSDCSFNCHEKCMSAVPKNCAKLRPLTDAPSLTSINQVGLSESAATPVSSTLANSRDMYRQFTSHVAETRTHEGYLYKRGALLKGWKQRWFVLDSMKHQMRYYDSMDDSQCKGYVDLAEVTSVNLVKSVQGAPKKTDDNSFFEMKTVKRFYTFCSQSPDVAAEWVEKIQSCIA